MNKSAVTIAVIATLAPAWQLQAAAPPGLQACGAITDSQARLECFDQELAKSRPAAAAPSATSTAPAPAPAKTPAAAVAVAPAAAAPAADASFGAESLAPKEQESQPEEQPQLHAKITSLHQQGANNFYVYLDNGQVWRHEDIHLGSYLRAGDAITITKAKLSSYRLTRDAGASKDWIRTTRVR